MFGTKRSEQMAPTQTAPQYRTRLEQIIDLEGRKQTWLAEQAGVSRAQMSNIVRGLVIEDEAIRLAIADALGRTVADVFGAVQS